MFQICKKTRSLTQRHVLSTEKYVFFEKSPKIAIFGYFSYKKWLFLEFSQKIRNFECLKHAAELKNGVFHISGTSFFNFFIIHIGRSL